MHYLFGFGGRINRAKIWLFILVTLAWELVIALVAGLGLDWTQFHIAVKHIDAKGYGTTMILPDTLSGPVQYAAGGIIALLVLLYAVAFLAVYTKRLHDRNKSAWWLVPFVVIPFGVQMLGCIASPALLDLGRYFGPLGMGWDAADAIAGLLALWAFIELFFFRGTHGANRYGPDPLA
jgi:uncharacterized membrane protein YhaH (DUF805 family)